MLTESLRNKMPPEDKFHKMVVDYFQDRKLTKNNTSSAVKIQDLN